MNLSLIGTIATLAYVMGISHKAWQTFKLKNVTTSLATKVLLIVGLVFHGILLYKTLFQNSLGVNLGLFNMASLIAWFILLISLYSIFRNRKLDHSLFIVIPYAVISIICSLSFAGSYQAVDHFSNGLLIHILLSIAAYSILGVAAIQATLLFVQENTLKKKSSLTLLKFLPPLDAMEEGLFDLIKFGLVLLSISIISGVIYTEDFFAQHLAHKSFFTVLSWFIFSALLVGRQLKGWRGKTAVKWTIAGFIFLMLAYFGSKFVLEIILMKA